MSEQSANLALPYLQPSQAQKHVTHNEALALLDLVVQLTVLAFDAQVPPPAAEGEIWSLGAAPTGNWAGHGGTLAAWSAGGWQFITPREGWRAFSVAEGAMRVYTGGVWQISGGGTASGAPLFGINATADTTNRLTVSSAATLLNHAGAGHQLKLNKSAPGDTASLLFQSGFSGRAEMGLAGTDAFSVKVSADGATWHDGLTIAGDSGRVTVASLLRIAPGTAPASPVAGDLYFDGTLGTLRCHDGTAWHNLF